MLKIFISYNRQSETFVRTLANDIGALGHTTWFDKELSGGQPWWDKILSVIRDYDVFVFVLSPEALSSIACKREYGYAADLGKPILPVLVSDEGVSTNLLPPALSQIQFVDYRNQDRNAVLRLGRALNTVPRPRPLPDPLPPPPEIPVSYLGNLTEQIETTSTLNYEAQSAILVDLKQSLRHPETGNDAYTLLKKMRKRRDLFATIAEEIDESVQTFSLASPAKSVSQKTAPPKIPKKKEPVGTINKLPYVLILYAGSGALIGGIINAFLFALFGHEISIGWCFTPFFWAITACGIMVGLSRRVRIINKHIFFFSLFIFMGALAGEFVTFILIRALGHDIMRCFSGFVFWSFLSMGIISGCRLFFNISKKNLFLFSLCVALGALLGEIITDFFGNITGGGFRELRLGKVFICGIISIGMAFGYRIVFPTNQKWNLLLPLFVMAGALLGTILVSILRENIGSELMYWGIQPGIFTGSLAIGIILGINKSRILASPLKGLTEKGFTEPG